MYQLNLPEYQFRMRKQNDKMEIFDDIRKKYIVLTPEEWVRQNFIQYLIKEKQYPTTLIAVEKALKLNKLSKRSDIVVYNRNGIPKLIVECKAPEVKVNQKVFDQIAMYNMVLKTHYLIVTNGVQHIACKLDFEQRSYEFLNDIPLYQKIVEL